CLRLANFDPRRMARQLPLHFATKTEVVLKTRIGVSLARRDDSMSASDEIYGKVTQVLVESLNVDEGDVTPTATLQGDLGAESIDFLDIVSRLEPAFGTRIPRGELFPESVFQGDPDFVRDGRVTEQGMGALRSRMPYADSKIVASTPSGGKISNGGSHAEAWAAGVGRVAWWRGRPVRQAH